MLAVPMRTFPGLFVGRRTVLLAEEAPRDTTGKRYVCGACEDELALASDPEIFRDVVVRCRCGEFNQL